MRLADISEVRLPAKFIELGCDGTMCRATRTIVASTWSACEILAELEGWKIGKDGNPCLCPECARSTKH